MTYKLLEQSPYDLFSSNINEDDSIKTIIKKILDLVFVLPQS